MKQSELSSEKNPAVVSKNESWEDCGWGGKRKSTGGIFSAHNLTLIAICSWLFDFPAKCRKGGK